MTMPKPCGGQLRLHREIAALDARIQHSLRILDRRGDYLDMIDWSAMTRSDRETTTTHEDNIGFDIYEWDYRMREASDKLAEHYLDRLPQ